MAPSLSKENEMVQIAINRLKKLIEKKKPLNLTQIDNIGRLISKFSRFGKLISTECAHKFFTVIGGCMELSEESYETYSKSEPFINSIVMIIDDFRKIISGNAAKDISQTCYDTHRCYEMTLFMALSLVEKSASMKQFCSTINERCLELMIESIGFILQFDYSYVTQEVALDIVCRFYIFLKESNRVLYHWLMEKLPKPVVDALNDQLGPQKILQDMRQTINKVNELNPNIKSVSIKSCELQINEIGGGKLLTKVSLKVNKWLDISKKQLSFILMPPLDVLIKIPYEKVRSVTTFVQAKKFFIKVQLEDVPSSLSDLLKPLQFQVLKHEGILIFDFGADSKLQEIARVTISNKMMDIDMLDNHREKKLSAVSSKDLSPSVAKVSLSSTNFQWENETNTAKVTPLIESEFSVGPEEHASSITDDDFVQIKNTEKRNTSSFLPLQPKSTAVSTNSTDTKRKRQSLTEISNSKKSKSVGKENIDPNAEKKPDLEMDIESIKFREPFGMKLLPLNASNLKENSKVLSNPFKRTKPVVDTTSTPKMRAKPIEQKDSILSAKSPKSSTIQKHDKTEQITKSKLNQNTNVTMKPSVRESPIQPAMKDILVKPFVRETPMKTMELEVISKVENKLPKVELKRTVTATTISAKAPSKEYGHQQKQLTKEHKRDDSMFQLDTDIHSKPPVIDSSGYPMIDIEEEAPDNSSEYEDHPIEILKKPLPKSVPNENQSRSWRSIPLATGRSSAEPFKSHVEETKSLQQPVEPKVMSSVIPTKPSKKEITKVTRDVMNEKDSIRQKPQEISSKTSWRSIQYASLDKDDDNDDDVEDNPVNDPMPNSQDSNHQVELAAGSQPSRISESQHSQAMSGYENLYRINNMKASKNVEKVPAASNKRKLDENIPIKQSSKHGSGEALDQMQAQLMDESMSNAGVELSDISHSTGEEDNVISMLLSELISMQKSRANRKQTTIIKNAIDSAETQVFEYLHQWKEVNQQINQDYRANHKIKLERIGMDADVICEQLAIAVDECARLDQEVETILIQSERDIVSLQSDLKLATNLHKDEMSKLMNMLESMKRGSLDYYKKNVSLHHKERLHGSKTQQKELLKALREI